MGEEYEFITIRDRSVTNSFKKEITDNDINDLINDIPVTGYYVPEENSFNGDIVAINKSSYVGNTNPRISLNENDILIIKNMKYEIASLRVILAKLLSNPAIKSIINLTSNEQNTIGQENKSNS